MNDTTCSCSHFSNNHFFRRKAIWDVEKIPGKSFTWISNGESESMLPRFATMCICETIFRVTPQKSSTKDSQVWTWLKETQNPDDILFSMPREIESTREKSVQTRRTDSETMKAARTYRRTPRRCTFRYRRDLWLHRCRQHSTRSRGTKNILELFRNFEFESIRTCSVLQEWSKEIQKLRIFTADIASSLWEKPVLLQEQAINWTKARVYVDSDSVLCLDEMNDPRGAIKVEWSSANLEDVSYLQRIARIGWRVDWLRVEDIPRSHSIGHSPQNSSRLTRKAHQTWKLQWSNNLL